ncbi:MAG TPA: pitrilysin family protein [Limnochordales bacterium]
MPKKAVLPSGLRVITERVPGVRSVAVGIWVPAGSRDEAPEQSGIAHFVEHMLFKGTRRRSARDIAEAIDATGGQLNAFTTKETTCYYARVLDEHLPLALDILADMLLESTFRPEDLVRERDVIVEEIRLVEDTPEDLVHDLFEKALFGAHPLARPVLGSEETVSGCTRQDLLQFVETHYTPGDLVIAAAGSVDHDALVAMVGKLFDGPARSNGAPGPVPFSYQPAYVMAERDSEQVHLCVGVPALPRNHPQRFALHLLDTLLGGGMSSRLFQELRENRGLVYSTYSYHSGYRDTGVLGVYAGTSPDKAAEVLDLIRCELAAVHRGGISAEELDRAKQQTKGALVLSLENTTARMNRLGRSELDGQPYLSPRQLMRRIDAVSLEDVRRLAEELLAPERLTIVGLGAIPDALLGRRLAEAAC